MKKLFRILRLPPEAEEYKTARRLWMALALTGLGCCVGVLSLVFSATAYVKLDSAALFRSYLEHPWILLLNLLPPVLLIWLFYFLTCRAWAGFLSSFTLTIGVALVNYFKIRLRSDPFLAADLRLAAEAKGIVGGYTLDITWLVWFALGCLIAGLLFTLFLLPRGLRGWQERTFGGLSCMVLMAVAFVSLYLNPEIYQKTTNIQHINQWSDVEVFVSKGGPYPFLYSFRDLFPTPPPGYNQKAAAVRLAEYPDSPIPEGKRVSVMGIMLEAFCDLTDFAALEGQEGVAQVYAPWHDLERRSVSGNLLTNIFAGGTVDTERCFLTGNYQLKNFRSNANSYLWYLRDQGYTVEGSHPYYQWFYNRQNINCYLGFERYRYYEGDYETRSAAIYPEDAVLLPEIYSDFQKNKATGKPYFSFSVNVQSHGPYATWDTGSPDCFADETYSLACRNAMNYYLATIWETDRELAKLMDWLRDDEEPVVLVTFGDHLPWMGDGNAFYEEMGIDVDPGTEEGFCRHYTTRYLIWANGAARALLGKDLQGQGPDISPCYLMNLVFQQLGWEGPAFMQAMTGMMNMFPVVSSASGLTMVDGRLTADIPEDRRALFQEFLYLQQYWRNEFLYE